MRPIWIIDLGRAEAVGERLRILLGSASKLVKSHWHYLQLEDADLDDMEGYRQLMERVVSDGRECYNGFVEAGYDIGTFQVVVLGAADEGLSQRLFAPLAGLLRDSMPRIISDHANRGVEVTGLLYIPSTINQTDDRELRTRTSMLLEALNTLCQQLGPRHYNHVVAYQDVQWSGNRYYPRLDDEGRADLLHQLLVNLYYGDNHSERPFDRTGHDSGIFSLGAASIYYDSSTHRQAELGRLLQMLIAEFKNSDSSDSAYANTIVRETLDGDALDATAVSARLREGAAAVEIDLEKVEGEADPHPVWDMFRVELFPRYYHRYLKYMPARLTRYMQSLHYILLTRMSTLMRHNREQSASHHRSVLLSLYRKVLLDPAARFATIEQLEAVFATAREYLLRKRSEVALTLAEVVPIPEYLRNDYDRCLADEESNNPSAIMDKIKKNLRREPVVLSLTVRCFLLGILLVFTVIPVLRVISPNIVNLGDIATMEWLWIPVLMLLPLVVNLIIRLRRHFKRLKRLRRRLLAATLLAANRRLSQVLMEEQGAFYDTLVSECDTQQQLLVALCQQLQAPQSETSSSPLPTTRFNQPLLGGNFGGSPLLTDTTKTEASIRLDDTQLRLSQLEQQELLAMLKTSFRQPEVLDAADMSKGDDPNAHAAALVEAWSNHFAPQLHITTAENMGLMLEQLGKDVDLEPFIKMAGVNGMLFSVASGGMPVLRISYVPQQLGFCNTIADAATTDYAMLTTWQRVTLQSQQVCNSTLEPLPPLTLADKLALYYAYYRQRDLAYTLAGQPLRIARDEMELLDKQIIGG